MKSKNSQRGLGMVDVSQKDITERYAKACANVHLGERAFNILMKKGSPKGDVFETAKIAGIMAAKSTFQMIPLCHPLGLNKIEVSFETDQNHHSVTIYAEIKCQGRTGVEMEALSAVTIAALTIYDMMKWAEKGMVIRDIKLLQKSGGKSGEYKRT